MKFKVGDKVRNVGDGHRQWGGNDGPKIGGVYTVSRAREGEGSFGFDYIQLAEFSDAYPSHARGTDKYELVQDTQQTGAPAFDLLGALTGKPLKFRSGCDVKFVAYVPDAKPHCQLVLLNPATGNVVNRYANGKSSEEPYNEPGDIILKEQA